MRAIKNFFHDINDILLAVIIVVIAAGVIYWRMGIILDYPRQLAAQQASYEQEAEDVYDDEEAEDAEAADAAEDAGQKDAEAGDTEAAPEPQG